MKTLLTVILLLVALSIQATVYDIVMKKEKNTWQRTSGTMVVDNINNTVTLSDSSVTYIIQITSPAKLEENFDANNTRIETRISAGLIYRLGNQVKCTFISVWSEFSTVSLIIIYLDDYEMELVRYKVQ